MKLEMVKPGMDACDQLGQHITSATKKIQRQMERVLIQVLHSAWMYIELYMKAEDTAWPIAARTPNGYEVCIDQESGAILNYCSIATVMESNRNENGDVVLTTKVTTKFHHMEDGQ